MKSIPSLGCNCVNITPHNGYSRSYLDFLFSEMIAIVFKSFRLLPGALSSLQVIVIVISVLDAMFYPYTSAAWRRGESTP